jgi:hypothetical protein
MNLEKLERFEKLTCIGQNIAVISGVFFTIIGLLFVYFQFDLFKQQYESSKESEIKRIEIDSINSSKKLAIDAINEIYNKTFIEDLENVLEVNEPQFPPSLKNNLSYISNTYVHISQLYFANLADKEIIENAVNISTLNSLINKLNCTPNSWFPQSKKALPVFRDSLYNKLK